MFNEKNIIEFINKIINQSDVDIQNETEENIRKFCRYLELTQMCDEETLGKIDKVLTCYGSLMDLKRNFGYVDVTSLFVKEPESKKLSKRPPKRQEQQKPRTVYEEKHYHHYVEPSYSSGCGGGSGGGSYRSGC